LLSKFLDSLKTSATLADAEAKLQVLAKGELRCSTSRATQGAFGAWLQLIIGMAKGIAPTAAAMRQDEAHRKMAQLLPQCLTCEVMTADGLMAIVSGKEAVAGIIAKLQEQGEPMNMEALSKIHAFAWLHTPEQAFAIADLSKKRLTLAKPIDSIVPMSTGNMKKDAKAKNKKKDAATVVADDDDIFNEFFT
jgi:hypothetical protein